MKPLSSLPSGALLGTLLSTGPIGAGHEPVSADQSSHAAELVTRPVIVPRPEPVSTNTHATENS
jgi:hypothetical protein